MLERSGGSIEFIPILFLCALVSLDYIFDPQYTNEAATIIIIFFSSKIRSEELIYFNTV